jgi:hypothetical protein
MGLSLIRRRRQPSSNAYSGHNQARTLILARTGVGFDTSYARCRQIPLHWPSPRARRLIPLLAMSFRCVKGVSRGV